VRRFNRHSIKKFSKESGGILDLDAELKFGLPESGANKSNSEEQ
jgi:hypothetical protein